MSDGRFKKGNPGGPGRPKGERNELCREFAESYGIPFLIRVAEGEEREVQAGGKKVKVSLRVRVEVAKYLVDQGIGRAPQRQEVRAETDLPVRFTLDLGGNT